MCQLFGGMFLSLILYALRLQLLSKKKKVKQKATLIIVGLSLEELLPSYKKIFLSLWLLCKFFSLFKTQGRIAFLILCYIFLFIFKKC